MFKMSLRWSYEENLVHKTRGGAILPFFNMSVHHAALRIFTAPLLGTLKWIAYSYVFLVFRPTPHKGADLKHFGAPPPPNIDRTYIYQMWWWKCDWVNDLRPFNRNCVFCIKWFWKLNAHAQKHKLSKITQTSFEIKNVCFGSSSSWDRVGRPKKMFPNFIFYWNFSFNSLAPLHARNQLTMALVAWCL